jgi:CheY-like chemotaxis protein
LYADDDPVLQHVMQRSLERLGHTVQVVSDGRQAFEAMQSQEFDVVMLDMLMPTMDGLEAAAQIRAYADSVGRRLQIIAVTSHRQESLGDRLEACGLDAFMRKPVRTEELAQEMANFATRAEG